MCCCFCFFRDLGGVWIWWLALKEGTSWKLLLFPVESCKPCGANGFRQKVWCPCWRPWLLRQLAVINSSATGLGWGCQVCCCNVRKLCREKERKTDEVSPLLSFESSPSVNDMSSYIVIEKEEKNHEGKTAFVVQHLKHTHFS